MRGFIIASLSLVLNLGLAISATYYVSNPTEFQNALNDAASDGEDSTIIVAPGTYNIPSTLTYNVAGGDGKLTIEAQDPNNKPILDGQNARQIMNIDTSGANGPGNDITVRNLVFQSGNHLGDGGGLYINVLDANVTVEGCEFRNNLGSGSASNGGGANISSTSGSVTLEYNTFENNESINDDGGGVYIYAGGGAILRYNTFDSNSVENFGGGVYIYTPGANAILENNIFRNNEATADAGGGAYIEADGGATLRYNIFDSNRSGDLGGGVYIFALVGAFVDSNTFYNNQSTSGDGGGAAIDSLFSIVLTNNIVYDNTAIYAGGIFGNSLFGWVILTNNTIYGNTANLNCGGALVGLSDNNAPAYIYNNIIRNNAANAGGNDGDDFCGYVDGDNDGIGSTIEVFNNDFGDNSDFNTAQSEDFIITDTDDGNYTHGNNITQDPLFVDPINGDFHLQPTSPAINSGDNNAPGLPSTDFEGDARIIGGVVDMGADEYNNPPVITSFTATPNSGNAPLTTTFSWNINDPDGDNLTCFIDVDDDGTNDYTINNCTSGSVQIHTYSTPGTYTARLTVDDGNGGTATQTTTVTVTGPTLAPEEPTFKSKKLSDESLIRVEDGLFNSVTELSSYPNECQVPPNVSVISLWLRFVAKVDTGKKGVWIELELTQPVPAGAKIGKCTPDGFKLLENVEINGNIIRFFVEDGGEYDYDGRVDGYVRDPFAVVVGGTSEQPQEQPEQPESGQEKEQSDMPPSYSPVSNSGSGGGGCSTGGMSILLSLLVFAVPFLKRLRG